MYLNILDLIPHHTNQLWSYDKNGFNGLINTLFWCSSVTFFTFYFFSKFLEVNCLLTNKFCLYKMGLFIDRDFFDRKKFRSSSVRQQFDSFGTVASTLHVQRSYTFTTNISLHREF